LLFIFLNSLLWNIFNLIKLMYIQFWPGFGNQLYNYLIFLHLKYYKNILILSIVFINIFNFYINIFKFFYNFLKMQPSVSYSGEKVQNILQFSFPVLKKGFILI